MNNPDNVPISPEDEVYWLNAYRTRHALSWSALEKETGIPRGTLTNVLTGKYAGDMQAQAERIFKFRQKVESQEARSQSALAKPRFIPTPTAATLQGLLEIAHMGRIIIAATGPGTGKTLTAEEYEASVSSCWRVTMRESTSSLSGMLSAVMKAMGLSSMSKIVAWRIGESESTTLARLAVYDMIRDVGIPKRLTTDNGRAFASKFFTGGTTTRFRGKVLETDPTGLLVALGIDIDWALPYRGQSKPIERAFRDLCDTISRAPATEGAYTGPNPQQKPENYGSRAMGWDEFVAHVGQGIALHNARLGRTGRDYRGRSFDQVFADTFVEIGKASPEQLRMALLAAEQLRVDRQTGEIKLFGNRYWAPECGQLHGQLVTVRFDPDNLHSEVHVYAQNGRFLLTVPVVADTGWGDAEGARVSAKRWKGVRRQIRDGIEAEQLLTAQEVAAMQPRVSTADLAVPDVIRPVRHRGQTAAALKAVHEPQSGPAIDPDREQVIDRIAQGRRRHLRSVD